MPDPRGDHDAIGYAPRAPDTVAVLAGGVGAARLLAGLVQVTEPSRITAIINVGDDLELYGLHISPDVDTVVYTLAGVANRELGWGIEGESWNAIKALERFGGITWFRLGDRDLATHLFRTQRLREGAPLSEVTAEIARAWVLEPCLLPVTDDPLRTFVDVAGVGEMAFQEYFVRHRHSVTAEAVRFEGAEAATPAPGVLGAIARASTVVIAPSNPIVSIGPVLAVPGVRELVASRRDRTVAVSPIVAGVALKGPADRMMTELGHESSALGIARIYRELAGTLVIDEADRALAPAIEAEGVRCVVAPTVMTGPVEAAVLAVAVLGGTGLGGTEGTDRDEGTVQT